VKQTIYSITESPGMNRLSAAFHHHRPVVLTIHGVTSDVSETIRNHEESHLHRTVFERLMHVAHDSLGDSDGDRRTGSM